MKQRYHYIISFNDLSDRKQNELMSHIKRAILGDPQTVEYLEERCGSDRYDPDRPDADRILDCIEGAVQHGCDRTAYEMEVEITL